MRRSWAVGWARAPPKFYMCGHNHLMGHPKNCWPRDAMFDFCDNFLIVLSFNIMWKLCFRDWNWKYRLRPGVVSTLCCWSCIYQTHVSLAAVALDNTHPPLSFSPHFIVSLLELYQADKRRSLSGSMINVFQAPSFSYCIDTALSISEFHAQMHFPLNAENCNMLFRIAVFELRPHSLATPTVPIPIIMFECNILSTGQKS